MSTVAHPSQTQAKVSHPVPHNPPANGRPINPTITIDTAGNVAAANPSSARAGRTAHVTWKNLYGSAVKLVFYANPFGQHPPFVIQSGGSFSAWVKDDCAFASYPYSILDLNGRLLEDPDVIIDH